LKLYIYIIKLIILQSKLVKWFLFCKFSIVG